MSSRPCVNDIIETLEEGKENITHNKVQVIPSRKFLEFFSLHNYSLPHLLPKEYYHCRLVFCFSLSTDLTEDLFHFDNSFHNSNFNKFSFVLRNFFCPFQFIWITGFLDGKSLQKAKFFNLIFFFF